MGKGDLTRSRILDEALRIASRDGLEGLSIGILASALDMSKSGLFAHFGSKESLQVAVLEHAGERFRTRLAPVEALEDGADRLRSFLRVLMDWVDDPDRPGGCPILGACFELDDREGAPREALLARQDAMARWLAATFRRLPLPPEGVPQALFEFQAITLAYHHAARVWRDPQARDRATLALEHLIARCSGG